MRSVKESLTFFADKVEQEQQLAFNMANWYTINMGQDYQQNEGKPSEVSNVCGTSACIAGTVAFALDPKSKNYAEYTCLQWVGCVENTWPCPTRTCLDRIFTNVDVYGHEHLEDISKQEVIDALREWAQCPSWEELKDRLMSL